MDSTNFATVKVVVDGEYGPEAWWDALRSGKAGKSLARRIEAASETRAVEITTDELAKLRTLPQWRNPETGSTALVVLECGAYPSDTDKAPAKSNDAA